MNLFPFSYRITAGGDIMSGILFDTPKFCCTNKNNPKCKRFYQSLKKTGIYQCPYGFGVEVLAYIIHSGFISGYQNRYGDNLKPPTNVYHRMTA